MSEEPWMKFVYKKNHLVIIQEDENSSDEFDVISLTPEQVENLLEFIKQNQPPALRLAKGRKAERKESK